jgi:hypothetical protein
MDDSVGSILEQTATDDNAKQDTRKEYPYIRNIFMTYNPDIHHRRSIRLRDYDYFCAGAYFVTLRTFDRGCYFDQFPQLREIVNSEWKNIPARFHYVDLDEYVIMPNHFHGIVIICRDTPRGYSESGYPNKFDVGAVPCARPIHAGHPQENQGTRKGMPLRWVML